MTIQLHLPLTDGDKLQYQDKKMLMSRDIGGSEETFSLIKINQFVITNKKIYSYQSTFHQKLMTAGRPQQTSQPLIV